MTELKVCLNNYYQAVIFRFSPEKTSFFKYSDEETLFLEFYVTHCKLISYRKSSGHIFYINDGLVCCLISVSLVCLHTVYYAC